MAVSAVKRLEGWVTLGEAADELGYSKQGLHRLIFESEANPFDIDNDVRGIGDRPMILIRTTAVEAMKERRRPGAQFGTSKLDLSPPPGK